MSLEIISPAGDFMYRQRPGNPCVLESRRNKRNSRWLPIANGRYPTPEEARSALLAMEAAWHKRAQGAPAEQEGE